MLRHHPRPRDVFRAREGFTLLEVLTVVMVLGIMAAVAIPATSSVLAQTRAAKAARIVATDLQAAFSLAAREKEPMVLTVNASGKSYTLANRSGTQFINRSFSTTSEALNISSMSATATSRTIYPNGMATGTLRITLVVGENTRYVDMTRVGMVRVSAP